MTQVEEISTLEHQCQLNFGWGTPELVAAADLIEDYWNNLLCSGPTSPVPGERARGTGSCKLLFQNWLAQNPYYVVSLATTRMASNNWGAAATNSTLYIADYLWDRPTLQLRHRNPPQVNGGQDSLFTPAQAYAFLRHLTLERMRMHQVSWTAHGCDNLKNSCEVNGEGGCTWTTDQSPDWPPVKSGITEKGIVSEDARRQEYCNIPRYDGSYQKYPEIHLGNLIQQCELMLRRGDPACYDNVDWTDVPSYTYVGPDGDLKTTHLYPGRGSLERALDAILIDAGAEWRRSGALWVAYRYYRNHKRLAETDLSQWVPYLGSGAGKCYQDICFGTLTHGFAPEENPFLPPTVPPPLGLTFADQEVGTSSPAQPVTLSNTGTGLLTLSSITVSGDYAQTNDCGSTVAAGASCTISVTFTPTATGARSGELTITDDAAFSPQTVSLSGTGVAAAASPTRIKDLTFESGSLIDVTNGADRIRGTVDLETAAPLKGAFSVRVPNVSASNFEETFTPTDDAYVSFYIRLNALPASKPRIAFLSNAGTTVGNILLNTDGTLRLRHGSTTIGTSAVALIPGQLYRIGMHQKRGTGGNAVLEAFLAANDDPFGPPFAATNAGTWTTAADRFRAGATTGTAVDIVFDDIKLDGGSMPPPSGVAGTAPIVSLLPPTLTFSDQEVSTTSAPQAVTLSNTGTGPLAITSIVASGDYAQTNSCGSSVAAGANCQIDVTFTPTAEGSRAGAVTITDDAADSPQTVNLSGTGVAAAAPVVSLSTTSLVFGDQEVSATSAPQAVTLSNTGTGPLAIASIVASGDYAQTNSCGSSVAAGANCQIDVTFTPTAEGSRAGAVTITDDAADSPQTVNLAGTGVATTAPAVFLSATSLNFGKQVVSTTSNPQAVSLTNTGTATLTITSITASGDYAQTNDCGITVAAGASCTISVTFTPTRNGKRTGDIVFTDNASDSPQLVTLAGKGNR